MISVNTTKQNTVLFQKEGIDNNNGEIWPNLLWRITINFLIYAVILVLLVYMIQWDAGIERENNLFSENSLTEMVQELFLVFIIGLFYVTGVIEKTLYPVTLIMSCMFGCALVREFDSFFDNNLFDGAWQLAVTVILVGMVVMVYRERRRFTVAVVHFVFRPPVGFLASGILTVMVFSRFFGQQLLWKVIMGDGFIRSVKNAAEEGVELFGYYLCLIAAIEYVRSALICRKLYQWTNQFAPISDSISIPSSVKIDVLNGR